MSPTETSPPKFPYIELGQAAKLTHYSRRSLSNRGREGRITIYKFAGGNRSFIKLEDFEALFRAVPVSRKPKSPRPASTKRAAR